MNKQVRNILNQRRSYEYLFWKRFSNALITQLHQVHPIIRETRTAHIVCPWHSTLTWARGMWEAHCPPSCAHASYTLVLTCLNFALMVVEGPDMENRQEFFSSFVIRACNYPVPHNEIQDNPVILNTPKSPSKRVW